jgi:DNA-binding NtrC family response regulator
MKKTILIIDDEPEIVELLTEFVKQLGHSALSASNGLQGLETATSQNPDLIISDINMPKMNGLEMLEKIKASGNSTPVILFTAFSDTQKIKTAWKLGAFDFVEKPIDFSALQKIIDKALHFGSNFQGNQSESKLLQSKPSTPVDLTIKLNADLHAKLEKKAKEMNLGLQDCIASILDQSI